MSTTTPEPRSGHIPATTTSLSKLLHEWFGTGDVSLVLNDTTLGSLNLDHLFLHLAPFFIPPWPLDRLVYPVQARMPEPFRFRLPVRLFPPHLEVFARRLALRTWYPSPQRFVPTSSCGLDELVSLIL